MFGKKYRKLSVLVRLKTHPRLSAELKVVRLSIYTGKMGCVSRHPGLLCQKHVVLTGDQNTCLLMIEIPFEKCLVYASAYIDNSNFSPESLDLDESRFIGCQCREVDPTLDEEGIELTIHDFHLYHLCHPKAA